MADRLERLTNLLALLLETAQPLSLHQIASELSGMYPDGLSARRGAFERDKALLREIGVPIETEIVASGSDAGQTRYWIDRRRYELEQLELDPEEQRALQVAIAATRQGSTVAQSALWKLGAGRVEVQPVAAAVLPAASVLADLRRARQIKAAVTMTYLGQSREVEPAGLLLREGFWYLVAFDRLRGERRTFRIDRIEGEVELGPADAYTPLEIDPAAAFPTDPKMIADDDSPIVHARVRIDAPRATLVARQLDPEQIIQRDPDGSMLCEVPYRNADAFLSWVLGLGPHAEVLEPESTRLEIIGWLEGVIAS